jgi:ribosomal protein L17
MRIYNIPTNRVCYEQAITYVEEVKKVKNKTGENIEFIILENGKDEVEKQNGDNFKAYNEGQTELEIYHVTKEEQRSWLKRLLNHANCTDKEEMLQILSPENVICYGAVLNKSFLIGASLGAESIHRRDSDTQLITNKSKPFPLEYEIKYLGKSYRDFEELHNGRVEPIYLVGGNYTGAWAGDFSDLYNKDPNLLYRHVALNYPGRTIKDVRRLVDKRYGKTVLDQTILDEDVTLVLDRVVELGNCAFSDIFKSYPVSPIKDMLATDYFIHDLLFAFQLPNLYHSARVLHEHTVERNNEAWFISYHLRSARYKVYNRFMNRFFAALIDRNSGEAALPKAKELAKVMNALYKSSKQDFISEGREVLGELSAIFRDSDITNYVQLSYILDEGIEDLLMEVDEGIKSFIMLLDEWDVLIEAAPSVPFLYRN